MCYREPTWLQLATWLAVTACVLSAGEFAPPAEGPVAFRRDRVPLEAAAMVDLSRRLSILAGGLAPESAVERRGAAQMLALAIALNPANAGARDLLAGYRQNHHQPRGNPEDLKAGREGIRQVLSWLETPEAGADGLALAACLGDVLRISGPSEQGPENSGSAAEQGAWAGWIPEISAYQAAAVVKNDAGGSPQPEPEPATREILLKSARVGTLLWQQSGSADEISWVLAPAALEMTAEPPKDPVDAKQPSFSVVIGNPGESGELAQLGNLLGRFLRKYHGDLARGIHIQIRGRGLESSRKAGHRQSFSAAAAVLASSAITGRIPDAVILGQIDKAGEYRLPMGFWAQLQSLGTGNGQRLVLPTEAATFLPSLLALEKPEFFLGYEVLLAADFKQLLDLTAKVPEEPLASATAKFQAIREKAGGQRVRQYIDNSFVKQLLGAVLQDMPSHVSAKMLLTQASGNRPVWVSRAVLAAELRRALLPMDWVATGRNFALESAVIDKVGETYDLCRTGVEALDRYVARNDRILLEKARELVLAIRALERAASSRGEPGRVVANVQSELASLRGQHAALVEQLALESGDALPVPAQ